MDGFIIAPPVPPRKPRRARAGPFAPACPACPPIQLRFVPALRLVYCPTCEYACRLTPLEATEYADMLLGLPLDARPDLFLAAVLVARTARADLPPGPDGTDA